MDKKEELIINIKFATLHDMTREYLNHIRGKIDILEEMTKELVKKSDLSSFEEKKKAVVMGDSLLKTTRDSVNEDFNNLIYGLKDYVGNYAPGKMDYKEDYCK